MPADMSQSDYDAFARAISANRADTGLRGVFADFLDEHGRHEEAAYHRRWTPEVGAAEDWLADFADKAGLGYEETIRAAAGYARTGHEWGVGTNFEPENILGDGGDALATFWRSIELVTGSPVKDGDKEIVPFQCCRWEDESGDPDKSHGWM